MVNPDNFPKPESKSPLVDAERSMLTSELLDPSAPIERLREIHQRSREIEGQSEVRTSQPSVVAELTDEQLNSLLFKKDTSFEVLKEIYVLVKAREADNTLPPAAE